MMMVLRGPCKHRPVLCQYVHNARHAALILIFVYLIQEIVVITRFALCWKFLSTPFAFSDQEKGYRSSEDFEAIHTGANYLQIDSFLHTDTESAFRLQTGSKAAPPLVSPFSWR